MSYKQAYFHIFNRITDIIELLASLDCENESVDVSLLLKALQSECEEIIIIH